MTVTSGGVAPGGARGLLARVGSWLVELSVSSPWKRVDSSRLHTGFARKWPVRFVARDDLVLLCKDVQAMGYPNVPVLLTAGEDPYIQQQVGETHEEFVEKIAKASPETRRRIAVSQEGHVTIDFYYERGPLRGPVIWYANAGQPHFLEAFQRLVADHTRPCTRAERRNRAPLLDDIDRQTAEARIETRAVEHSAARISAIWGGVFGAVAGGVVAWIGSNNGPFS